MLKYKEVMQKLKQKGYTSTYLRTQHIMGESKMHNIRHNKVDAKTINQICQLLNCQPGDILEYVPDESENN